MGNSGRYSTLTDEQLRGVDAACAAFEDALHNEQPIPIEDCLAGVSEDIRRPLFRDLLAIELERQLPEARPRLVAAYRTRFPDRTDDVERVSADLAPPADDTPTLPARGPVSIPSYEGPVSIPGYEIEGVLGRGGMGVVYKARHLKLKRTVALKMILAGGHAGPRELARFRIEAEAVARLQHPNIVQIHEVGEAGGYPYCALEFVEGGNLAVKLDGKPMPTPEAAKLVESLARATQLAHSRNVVHRDLKPANIMLTADGTPKITDFGLARQLDSDSGETQTGAVLGTPAYMAPEQASGDAHEAGPAADVYSLGAILYDCLTGRPPFRGKSAVETLDLVRSEEATAPSRMQAGVPLDLDTICLKCLRKEPENRYASAAELADELGRFLRGEPILARPVGRVERARKWVRRNPGVAAALAGLAGVILTAFVLVTWSLLRAEDALSEEATQRRAADDSREEAQREQKAERWARYRSNIAAASAALQLQNTSAVRSALDDAPQEHRNWEWQYLHSQLDGARIVIRVPTKHLNLFVISPAATQIAVLSSLVHNEIYLYDVATGKLDAVLRGHSSPPTSVAYHPDGKQIASSGEDAIIRVWDAATGRELASFRSKSDPPNPKLWTRIVYNADGSRIASFSGSGEDVTSRLWDTATGKEIAVLAPWQKGKGYGEFSPDGKRIAVNAGENVNLCDAVTGQRLAVLETQDEVRSLTYSPDGKRIAFLSSKATHLWDGESGKAVNLGRGNWVTTDALRFSPDGSRLASGSAHPDSTASLWDAATGRPLAVLAGHKNTINTVAFSPDGKRVATASMDQTARLWDGITGQSLAVLRGHSGYVWHVVFSPDGTRLVTAADDLTLRLWDAQTGELLGVLRGHGGSLGTPVFTPDGSRLVTSSVDGTVRIWEMTEVERNVLRGHESFVYDVAFSPDGEQVASAAWDGTARLWDATTGRQTGLLKHETKIISSVAYSRDGRQLVTMERERGVTLWDVASRKAARNWRMANKWFVDVRATLNPKGTLVVAASPNDGLSHLWDVASGRELKLFGNPEEGKHPIDLAFHPDGNLLATGSSNFAGKAVLQLWDVASWTRVAELRGHTDSIWRVAFSTDGKLLASASADKTVRLWDSPGSLATTATREALAVIPLGSIVYGVAFSPDGTRLAAGCADGSIRLIDVARRVQVAELRGHGDYVHAVAWSPDGTRLVSGSGDTTVRVWDSLPPSARTARTPDAARR